MDGKNESLKKVDSSEDEEDGEEGTEEEKGPPSVPEWHSVTEEMKPVTRDR